MNKVRLKNILKKGGRAALYMLGLFFITSFFYILYLKWFPPVTTTLMVERACHSGGHGIRCHWAKYVDMAPNVKVAVIAEEDQNFPFHNGFDLAAIQKAFRHNSHSKRIRGASTISQQVAKNVFLWNGRSWIRKGFEVYFTFMIERIWGKKRILQMYLNVAEMGDGVFGVEAASEVYFHKRATQLTVSESALLASVLPNPREFRVSNPNAYIKRKQARVIRAMKRIGGAAYLNNL